MVTTLPAQPVRFDFTQREVLSRLRHPSRARDRSFTRVLRTGERAWLPHTHNGVVGPVKVRYVLLDLDAEVDYSLERVTDADA